MLPQPNPVEQLFRALDDVPPEEILPVVRRALQETIGASDVVLLLADYAEATLERFEPERTRDVDRDDRSSLPVESTAHGACYQRQEVLVEHDGDRWSILAPVTVRSERFGVLEVDVAAEPAERAKEISREVASALGYVVAAAQRYTDVFERVRRRRNLALAAEMQWELLPVLGYASSTFSLAGSLEPAYDVGGDTFDYAVDGDQLTLSISDAMGHGLRSALCATLVVTAMRNARRAGESIVEQVQVANQVLCEQFRDDAYVTALVIEIDLATGRGTAVNAGHPPPWLQGASAAGPLVFDPDRPLGLFADTRYRHQPVQLERGDRLVLLTDGIVEAGPNRDDTLGYARFGELVAAHRGARPHELVRRIIRAVCVHRGAELLDDATLLCLDWQGDG